MFTLNVSVQYIGVDGCHSKFRLFEVRSNFTISIGSKGAEEVSDKPGLHTYTYFVWVFVLHAA